jgi:hypothetical protein
MRTALLSSLLSASAACLIACAVGASDTEPADLVAEEENGGGSVTPKADAGSDRDAGGKPGSLADAASASDAGSATFDAATVVDAATTIDAGRPVDAGMPSACSTASTCPTAISVGTVSGDTNADVVNVSGIASEWYKITVTEDSNGIGGRKLKLRATLTSPPGVNFDLYMYEDAPGNCTSATQQSVVSSGSDSVSAVWGEGTISNGSSDTKDVYVEVRHTSGICSAGAVWSLKFEGNQ